MWALIVFSLASGQPQVIQSFINYEDCAAQADAVRSLLTARDRERFRVRCSVRA